MDIHANILSVIQVGCSFPPATYSRRLRAGGAKAKSYLRVDRPTDHLTRFAANSLAGPWPPSRLNLISSPDTVPVYFCSSVAAVFHLHGERNRVAADFAVHDRDITTAGDGPGQFAAIRFKVEGLLARSTLATRHLSGPRARTSVANAPIAHRRHLTTFCHAEYGLQSRRF
jgi:hypothetical protein